MNDDVARTNLASCGTHRIRAKLVRRLHWLFRVVLHRHIVPMDSDFFKPFSISPVSVALPLILLALGIYAFNKKRKAAL